MSNEKMHSDKCSFCGRTADQVDGMVAGPNVNICNECIALCNDIIENQYRSESEPLEFGQLPKPMEIKEILDQYVIGQEDAKKVLSVALEKVRKELRGSVTMRTFAVTADMDGETGELVRVHHHVVVTATAAQTIADRWGHGIVHTENLYKQDDYTPLAAYLLGQVRHREGKKKYSCSRNMVKPKVEEQVLAEAPDNEIRVQPGAKVLDRTPYREGTLSQYVRYKRKPKAAKRGGHKEGSNGACGGTEICQDAKGGSGHDFQKITWS
jgi:hypothetical protein